MENNQKIKCEVESCKFQDENYCTLKEILISYITDNNKATKNKETLCKSFECSKNKNRNYQIVISVFISPSLPFSRRFYFN